jgi:hypothetical protein
VPVAIAVPISTPLLGLESSTRNVSTPSCTVSLTIGTWIWPDVAPAAITSVPVPAVKSSGDVAVAGLAVQSIVSWRGAGRVSATGKTARAPLTPSLTRTSAMEASKGGRGPVYSSAPASGAPGSRSSPSMSVAEKLVGSPASMAGESASRWKSSS